MVNFERMNAYYAHPENYVVVTISIQSKQFNFLVNKLKTLAELKSSFAKRIDVDDCKIRLSYEGFVFSDYTSQMVDFEEDKIVFESLIS